MRQSKSNKSNSSIQFQSLEPRVLFCGYHADTPAGSLTAHPAVGAQQQSGPATIAASGGSLNVPVLNSLPGAKASIYLDFDGDVARTWGSFNVTATPAYDIDGNAGGFSAQELKNINEIFNRVAEKFSVFNINVTTVRPASFADKSAIHVVIGGNGAWLGQSAGGVSYVGSFYNSAPNQLYAFTQNLGNGFPKYVAEAISHEAGHAFGLQHQSAFSGTTMIEEYSSGNGMTAPTMGNSYSSIRGLWWMGTASTGANQDDLSVIAGSLNGFGYRKDDHGSAASSARVAKFKNGKFLMKGVLTSIGDKDFFTFTVSYGQLQLKLRAAGEGAMLDGKLRLYKGNGTTILNNVDNTNLSETITRTLTPGTYYAAVFSHGSYGDVGQYLLYGYHTPSAAPVSAPVGKAAPSPFSNTKLSSSDLVSDLAL